MADPIDTMQPVRFDHETSAPTETKTLETKETVTMSKKQSNMGIKIIFALVLVIAGIGTGYALAKMSPAGSDTTAGATLPSDTNDIKVGAVFGTQDTSKDNAEGVLVKGGIDGEGSHHLMREGGVNRNVYMTSSTLDLSLFDQAKVKVWGDTFNSQKAGWLMDVSRVEVIELNAPKPFEEPGQTQVLEGE